LPGFLATITRAYGEHGRPIELIKLLDSLVGRQWAAPVAAEMYKELVDNSELIGDVDRMERDIKAFLRKYPQDPRSRGMTERLGALYFSTDKHQLVKDTLLWLINKGERAQRAESYYMLGKSLCNLRQYPQAVKAMDLFFASAGAGDARLLPDAYIVAASSRDAAGDRKGALKFLEAALKLPDNKRLEESLYKAADINLRDGNPLRARQMLEQLVKTAKDPDWQKLARQALDSLELKTNKQ
jgi:TolA-binding protein